MISLVVFLAQRQIVFFVWVTFGERKWSILAERRGGIDLEEFTHCFLPVPAFMQSCRTPASAALAFGPFGRTLPCCMTLKMNKRGLFGRLRRMPLGPDFNASMRFSGQSRRIA
jgi:hypothetical protein